MNVNETAVAEALRKRGFQVVSRGWPDLLCVRRQWDKLRREYTGDFTGMMAVEVKAGKDRVSEDQDFVHRALRSVGVPVYVVTPQAAEHWAKSARSNAAVFITTEEREATIKRMRELEWQMRVTLEEHERLKQLVVTSMSLLEPSLRIVDPTPEPSPDAPAMAVNE